MFCKIYENYCGISTLCQLYSKIVWFNSVFITPAYEFIYEMVSYVMRFFMFIVEIDFFMFYNMMEISYWTISWPKENNCVIELELLLLLVSYY